MTPGRPATIDRLLAVLESARARKPMFFQPVEPKVVEDWLSGLRVGCTLAGLSWSPDARRPALARRGLELTAAWESPALAALGLTPEAVVEELLAIEIEMWQHVGMLVDFSGDAFSARESGNV